MTKRRHRKPLGAIVRQSDGVRFGLFATDDPAFPLLSVEQDEFGKYDRKKGRLMSAELCFGLLSEINKAQGTH